MGNFTLKQYADIEQHTTELHEHARDLTKQIIIDIKAGKLGHNQKRYHDICGTKHCIAGWLEVKILEELNINWSYKSHDEQEDIKIEQLSPVIQKFVELNYYTDNGRLEPKLDDVIWVFGDELLSIKEQRGIHGTDTIFQTTLDIEEIIKNWDVIVRVNDWNQRLIIER